MHAPSRPPKNGGLKSDNTLHVVAVVSNPIRFQSRYRLYENFEKVMKTFPEVHLVTVEAAFADRHHEVTDSNNPDHLQVRSKSEVWIKENMINLGVRHLLPSDWRYVAWVDADVAPLNPDWAQETLHQLQHHPVVQAWENVIDLGPRNNVVATHTSFAKLYRSGAPYSGTSATIQYPYTYWHSGFAWAATRTWWENTGGLIDKAILGAADHHMATSMAGFPETSIPAGIHPNYRRLVMDWSERAQHATQGNLGFVEGSLNHFWHGRKADRKYKERWEILKEHQFDPVRDVSYNQDGVLELHAGKPGFKRDLQEYFRGRDEDSRDE
jgi:hypothetical protein